MKWDRVSELLVVGLGTFAVIWVGGVLLALLWPTSSLSRLASFNAMMFAITGGVLAVVIWAAGNRRGS